MELRTSVLAMDTRRSTWLWTRVVRQEFTSGLHDADKENINPMLGDELGIAVQERHILVRCQPSRRHPRIPLRDITHLFRGNVASLEGKTDGSPPIQQALGIRLVRRPFPSAASQDFRKRWQSEPSSELASEMPSVRRVLRKFR